MKNNNKRFKKSLYDEIGGTPTLQKVHHVFYNKVYAHNWLKHFFVKQPQSLIENQQTSFMAEKMGGPKEYVGKPPKYTHIHMYITNELFDIRQALLAQAIEECGISERLKNKWLIIDNAFRPHIVKESLEAFYEAYTFKERIIVSNPDKKPC